MLKAMDYVTAIQGKGIFLSDKYRKNDSNEMALEWFRENGRSMIRVHGSADGHRTYGCTSGYSKGNGFRY